MKTDTSDLDLLKQGDNTLLNDLYETLYPKIRSWIIKHGGDSEASSDVFQEVLLSIITGDKTKIDNIRGFIFNICKFRWIDQTRKNKSKQKVIYEDHFRNEVNESIEAEYIELEKEKYKFKVLEDSFVLISENCQKLLNYFKEGKESSEIVEIMDFNSAKTLYRRKFACINSWKKHIQNHPLYELIQ